jgi:hypothetical protein
LNPVLERPALETETFDPCDVHLKATDLPPHPRRVGLRWFNLALREIDTRRHQLARTHWKKIWLSIPAD